jgi:hypothetical protein
MARLGSFRSFNSVIYVFDDALVEMRPSKISYLADFALPAWIHRDMPTGSLDNRDAAVSDASVDISSQELAQQFKGCARTPFSEVAGVELQRGSKASTACDLVVRTTDGKTTSVLVEAGEAERARDLLARALGSRFQSGLSSGAPA